MLMDRARAWTRDVDAVLSCEISIRGRLWALATTEHAFHLIFYVSYFSGRQAVWGLWGQSNSFLVLVSALDSLCMQVTINERERLFFGASLIFAVQMRRKCYFTVLVNHVSLYYEHAITGA
jgi:hypothetical protein